MYVCICTSCRYRNMPSRRGCCVRVLKENTESIRRSVWPGRWSDGLDTNWTRGKGCGELGYRAVASISAGQHAELNVNVVWKSHDDFISAVCRPPRQTPWTAHTHLRANPGCVSRAAFTERITLMTLNMNKYNILVNSKIKVKVKAFHTRYRALGPELIPVYRQSARRWLEVIQPAVGCHYFPPGLRLPSQPQSITAPWPVPSYTAWWQRHIGVNNMPKVMQLLPGVGFKPTTCWSQVQRSIRCATYIPK